MCYGIMSYSCSHSIKKRFTCREVPKDAPWSCHAVMTTLCGARPGEQCDQIRADKHFNVPHSCPDCQAADESGALPHSRTTHNRFKSQLGPDGLRASRLRKEAADKKKEAERAAYRDDRIAGQIARRNATAYLDHPPMQMPSVISVPLGNRAMSQEPSYGVLRPGALSPLQVMPPAADDEYDPDDESVSVRRPDVDRYGYGQYRRDEQQQSKHGIDPHGSYKSRYASRDLTPSRPAPPRPNRARPDPLRLPPRSRSSDDYVPSIPMSPMSPLDDEPIRPRRGRRG
ncbi:hypothetical protein CGCS363_v000744 [Colletotrichum siamense]|uniref:uncharacterized protein n=1 Tax=Colletotrichum siamense TaxID=690259 RepID=UPI0018722349|nr:uncharacterized protein CGCS363_v000744 [Colletotrichum siamense]KAF5515810.1 hypothetical protein CGCS363_v000744 [Colletotrichum siamense]